MRWFGHGLLGFGLAMLVPGSFSVAQYVGIGLVGVGVSLIADDDR